METKTSKYKAKKIGEFKSLLEAYAAELLESNDLKFGYELKKFELIPKQEVDTSVFVGKKGAVLSEVKKVRPTTYTPDFINIEDKWVIETKGKLTPDFVLKMKLFLMQNSDYIFLMPRNKKQVENAVWTLKNLLGSRRSQ